MSNQGTWWCNTHKREATHIEGMCICCDPDLGGDMAPCSVEFKPELNWDHKVKQEEKQ